MEPHRPTPLFTPPQPHRPTDKLHPSVAAAYLAAHGALDAALSACQQITVRPPAEPGTQQESRHRYAFKLLAEIPEVWLPRCDTALRPVVFELQSAFESIPGATLPTVCGKTGSCGHDLAVTLIDALVEFNGVAELLATFDHPDDGDTWVRHWNKLRSILLSFESIDGDAIANLMWREAVRASELMAARAESDSAPHAPDGRDEPPVASLKSSVPAVAPSPSAEYRRQLLRVEFHVYIDACRLLRRELQQVAESPPQGGDAAPHSKLAIRYASRFADLEKDFTDERDASTDPHYLMHHLRALESKAGRVLFRLFDAGLLADLDQATYARLAVQIDSRVDPDGDAEESGGAFGAVWAGVVRFLVEHRPDAFRGDARRLWQTVTEYQWVEAEQAAVPVGHANQPFPAPPTPPPEEPSGGQLPVANEADGEYRFELLHGSWQLRFRGDPPLAIGDRELLGLRYIARLFQSPDVPISPFVLDGGSAMATQSVEQREWAASNRGEQKASPSQTPVAADGVDHRAKAESLRRMSRLKAEIAGLENQLEEHEQMGERDTPTAREATMALDAKQKELDAIQAYVDGTLVVPDTTEERRASARVWQAIRRAREAIGGRGMCGLRKYLDAHVKQCGRDFVYRPPASPPPFKLR